MNLHYDIEADWLLLTTCNFRCGYCFIPQHALAAKLVVHASPSQWAEAFDATGKTWMLHLTGGEPSIYPGFVELCEQLARNHYLSINSNLSHPSIETFAERMPTERVHYISAALHYTERQEKSAVDIFVARARLLQSRGFNVLVSAVMSPEMMTFFPEMAEHLEAQGLTLIPKVMRGFHEGSRYPDAYMDEEKRMIAAYLERAQRQLADTIARMGEAPTINMFADGKFLNGLKNYRGKMCGSGHRFARIVSNGTLYRCGTQESLGNILHKNVALLPAPQPCDTQYCPYFCEKYTSPQFTQMSANRV